MEGERYVEPIDLLRELYGRRIPYLLVGRQALVLLGAPLLTADYDFFLSPEREHVDAILELAARFELAPSVRRPCAAAMFSLLSDTQKFDFFRARSYATKDGDTVAFAELWENRRTLRVRDFEIWTPSLVDLVRTKRIRNSPKDREDIKYLQVMIEREQLDEDPGS